MSVSILEPREPDSAAIQTIEKLASRNPIEQMKARAALDSGESANVDALLHVLKRENRKKRRRFAVAQSVSICIMVGLAAANEYFNFNSRLFNYGFLFGVFLIASVSAAFAPTRLQRVVARRLADFDDVRAVGPLAEALDQQDKSTKKAAGAALARLLPRLRFSDSDLLNDGQRDFLLKGFGKGSRELELAVLKALPQIGDKRFVDLVSELAKGKGAAKRDPQLQDAAIDCLEPLNEQVERDRIRLTLLRPAEGVPASPDALLRPAADSPSDSSLLLRASSDDTDT